MEAMAVAERNEYPVYFRRHIIAALLCIFVTTCLFQMTFYTSNSNVITVYYGVSYVDVMWTLLVASFSSLVFFYPTTKCVELFGLRISMILSTAINALGASIKCIAIRRDYYWLLIVGQSMQSVITLIPFSLMPALGEHWYRRDEMGCLMGILTSLMTLGPIATFAFQYFLFYDTTIAHITNVLNWMNYILFAVCFLTFVFTLLLVQDKPPTPPGPQETEPEMEFDSVEEKMSEKQIVATLLKKSDVLLLIFLNAFISSSMEELSATLNQTVLSTFTQSNGNNILAISGVVLFTSGVFGGVLVGYVFYSHPKFKIFNTLLHLLFTLSAVAFVISLWRVNAIILITSMFFFGLIRSGINVVFIEYMTDVCFPLPGDTALSVAMAVGYIPSIILTPLISIAIIKFGAIYANLIIVSTVAAPLLISMVITGDSKRHHESFN